MKKQHFLNYYYQKLTLHQKINLKAFFMTSIVFDWGISEFEFLCLIEP